MKTTADYLDALRTKFNLHSDYALAKQMGWHRQHVSHYRLLKGTFDDEVALKIAGILDVDPGPILLDMHIQRAKCTEVKDAWLDLAKRLGGVAASVLLGIGLIGAGVAPSSGDLHGVGNVYYVKTKMKMVS